MKPDVHVFNLTEKKRPENCCRVWFKVHRTRVTTLTMSVKGQLCSLFIAVAKSIQITDALCFTLSDFINNSMWVPMWHRTTDQLVVILWSCGDHGGLKLHTASVDQLVPLSKTLFTPPLDWNSTLIFMLYLFVLSHIWSRQAPAAVIFRFLCFFKKMKVLCPVTDSGDSHFSLERSHGSDGRVVLKRSKGKKPWEQFHLNRNRINLNCSCRHLFTS